MASKSSSVSSFRCSRASTLFVMCALSRAQTFANDEGDDPSRVGAASDPLMEGMEQLDTVISFRDGGSGIAKELQRAVAFLDECKFHP